MRDSWTAEQWEYIEWLATPRYSRIPPTVEMVAAKIGVDDATLYRWQNLDGFRDEVNKLARVGLGKKLPELYGALLREAEAGSFQHLQLAFEMTGEYVRQQRNINDNKHDGEVTLKIVEVDASGEGD